MQVQEEIFAERRAIDEAVRAAIKEAEEYQASKATNLVSDTIHTGLDIGGLFPVVGEVFDGANSVYYLIEGNHSDAGLSFVSMIPVWGWFGTGGKWGKRIFHAADTGAGTGGKVVKNIDEAVKIVQSHVAADLAGKITVKYGVLECDKCAIELIQELQKRGINGNVVEIRANNGYDYIVSDIFGKPAITQNGVHYGVHVDGIVYDNIHKNGISYNEWLKDFHAAEGVSVKKFWDFESWLLLWKK
jgi:hypothetical protein